MSHQKLRKAIFPVAGLGTRFLPATKANPKEMLPIVDKPIIQYAVEEAIAAGIKELIFVTSSLKRSIEDHFDSNFELETKLKHKGNDKLLEIVQNIIPKDVACVYIRQPQALGLGHAVLCAKDVVGNEPFAVILADDLIDGGDTPCLGQMTKVYEKTQSSLVAVQHVAREYISQYGVVDLAESLQVFSPLQGIIEKPAPDVAPSEYGVVGRYILSARIFELLESTERGSGGEIQLTDAIGKLLLEETVSAFRFEGIRYDCGSKLGYLKATIAYALKHPEVGEEFAAFLQGCHPHES